MPFLCVLSRWEYHHDILTHYCLYKLLSLLVCNQNNFVKKKLRKNQSFCILVLFRKYFGRIHSSGILKDVLSSSSLFMTELGFGAVQVQVQI